MTVSFASCGGVWPVVLDKLLHNYVEDKGDTVISSKQQASYGAQFNTNGSQTALSSPIMSMSEWAPKPYTHIQHQMRLKEVMKNSKSNDNWIQKWSFYEVNVPITIAHHLTSIEIMKATKMARTSYKVPTYNAMHKKILDYAWYNTQESMHLKTKLSTNIVAPFVPIDGECYPLGDVFVGAIDKFGSTKNVKYIANVVK